LDQEKIKELYEIFSLIEKHYFSIGNEFIAGENLSIADFAYVTTITGLIVSQDYAY
jgi:glutathione S-transferase